MGKFEVGPTESLGIALEVMETLKLPSNQKTLEKILDFMDLSEEAYDKAVENLKFTYERM